MGARVSAVSPARALALKVLSRVRETEAYAPQALDAALARTHLSDEDAALAHRLVYGALQMQGSLDDAVDRFAARPEAIEPKVRDALRLAAYEVLFSRVPEHAAVDQGVELVRSVRPQAAGLANAVLRRLASTASEFPWGDVSDPTVLARVTGHPEWLVRLWLAEYGTEAARAVLDADNAAAPFYVAVNPFRATSEEATAALDSDGADPLVGPLPGCLECLRPSAAVASAAVRDGLVIVCDAAAQVAPLATGALPGGLVVDVAAGRGTKTALIQASAMAAGGVARVVALDIHPFKSRVLADRMESLGVPGVTVLTGDATDPSSIPGMPGPGEADAVLVDAPCTGLGTLRRHPERRWRVAPEDPARLAALGSRMLAAGARLVRVGGVVVYSTCTLAAEENECVVRGFLGSGEGAGFASRGLAPLVPESWAYRVTPEGWFRSLPETGGPDGHFVAVLERTG